MNLQPFGTGARVLRYHASLVLDEPRIDAYARALSRTIRAGDVVLDVGTGTGILAFLAARVGAARVYAVDRGEAIELARAAAPSNDAAGVVQFIRTESTELELPEPVDAIVTETLWNFGLGEGVAGAIIDARDRFLRPGGPIVPQAISMWCALVERSGTFENLVDVWAVPRASVDLSALRAFAANNVYAETFEERDLLSEPAQVAAVSLVDVANADVKATCETVVTRSGLAHGIAGWFDAELCRGISLSNRPPVAAKSWAHAFLPFERPLEVSAGAEVTIAIATSANGSHWSWSAARAGDRPFTQSTLLGLPTAVLHPVLQSDGH
jgi:protein arginine N-methyltransferase 1